ncbi:MAG TPA: Ig-like domain-containing protein [Gemmatimonadales bacterium]
MNAKKLSALMIAGLPLLYAACGGDNLTLPSEGEPAHITVVDGDAQSGQVGSQLAKQLIVQVTDAQNRPIAGATVEFVLDGDTGGGSASPSTGLTGSDGRASTSITLGTRVGSQTGHAQVPVDQGTPISTVFTATALPSTANGISILSGDGQSGPVGTTLALPLVVQVADAFGNPIAGVTIQWSPVGGGSVSETSNQTDANGQASVSRTLGPSAGQQTTLASADGLAGSPVTFTHTATAGSASRVEIVSGNGQSAPAGSQLPQDLVVRVLDEGGNPIVGRAVSWVVGVGGGSVTPETSLTDSQGQARASWTLGPTAGNNTLNAVVSGVGLATFSATATKVGSTTNITSDQPDPSTVGQQVRVEFTVTGSGGTPTGDVTVTVNGGSESCAGTVAAGFCNITLNDPGNRTLTATYGGDARFSGSSDTEDHRVDSQNSAPTAAFTPPSCTVGIPCQFTDASTDPDGNNTIVAWVWSFGDGQTSDQQNPTHTYAEPGTKTVTLAVSDDHQTTREVSHEVTVNPPPNSPPIAAPDLFSTLAGQVLNVQAPGVLANDTDPDAGDTLSAELLSSPTSGLVVLNSDGSFTYFPGSASGTQDTFTYSASDGTLTSTATVTITIQ